jgi:glutathione synthase/RimK-type ligase-like ATP-grasp enzyme
MAVLGILTEPNGWEKHYIAACEELGVPYRVIDIVCNRWWENLNAVGVDGYLVRASGDNEVRKQMYNERLYFIEQYMDVPMYPSFFGNLLYENKRMQSYWMHIHNIPHPETFVFYKKAEALDFIRSREEWPVVSKPNLGGSGSGIRILKNGRQAKRLVRKVFTRFKWYNPGITRWKKWRFLRVPVMDDRQHNYLFFQEFIHAKWEWRILKAGDTFFGHQKLARRGLHSGSGRMACADPPKELLEIVRKISEISGIQSLNVDILESIDGRFFVNEIQTYWGVRTWFQMKIEDKPARYLYRGNGAYELQFGDFHRNRGCNLRVEDFLKQLNRDNI